MVKMSLPLLIVSEKKSNSHKLHEFITLYFLLMQREEIKSKHIGKSLGNLESSASYPRVFV